MAASARILPALVILAIGLSRSSAALPQDVSSLRGSWTATIGARPALQGTWSAQLQQKTANTASGSWMLVGASGTVVARGTWAATKTTGSWSGRWSARASSGATRSGTWKADAGHGPATLSDLLRSTLEKQLTGAWRSAGLQGRWALRATP